MKTLHLTCKDKRHIDNPVWQACLQKYHAMYADYDIKLYDNNDIYGIVARHYPQFLRQIQQIRVGAVLADVFRYLILYLEGGVYSDMDCEPLKPIDNLLGSKFYHGDAARGNQFFVYPPNKKLCNRKWDFHGNPCNHCAPANHDGPIKAFTCLGHDVNPTASTVLCYEFHSDWHGREPFLRDPKWTFRNVGICQWFMITQPRQEVFLKMFMHCAEHLNVLTRLRPGQPNYHNAVINTCGPLAFTKVVLQNMTDQICILPSDFFCAGSWAGIVPQTKNSYIKHHFTGSWTK
jgi:hypothetical protein